MKDRKIFVAAFILVLIFGVLFIYGTYRHQGDNEIPASSEVVESEEKQQPDDTKSESIPGTAESANSGIPGSVAENNTAKTEMETNDETSEQVNVNTEGLDAATNLPARSDTEYVPFFVSEPKAQKNNGYTERIEPLTKRTNFELKQEKLDEMELTPVLDTTGNHKLVLNGQYILYEGIDENGEAKQYIISGADPVLYTGPQTTFDDIMVARQEETGKRIYLFDSQEDVDKFLKSREEGRAVLDSASQEGDWKIVLNGQLIDGASPMLGEDGLLYLPLRQLAEAYNPPYTQFDSTNGVLYIALDDCLFGIPCDDASISTKNKYVFEKLSDGYVHYRYTDMGVGGNLTTLTGSPRVPQTAEYCWVTPDDLAFILGWDISVKGHVIHVQSDPLDDSDLYILSEEVVSGTIEFE